MAIFQEIPACPACPACPSTSKEEFGRRNPLNEELKMQHPPRESNSSSVGSPSKHRRKMKEHLQESALCHMQMSLEASEKIKNTTLRRKRASHGVQRISSREQNQQSEQQKLSLESSLDRALPIINDGSSQVSGSSRTSSKRRGVLRSASSGASSSAVSEKSSSRSEQRSSSHSRRRRSKDKDDNESSSTHSNHRRSTSASKSRSSSSSHKRSSSASSSSSRKKGDNIENLPPKTPSSPSASNKGKPEARLKSDTPISTVVSKSTIKRPSRKSATGRPPNFRWKKAEQLTTHASETSLDQLEPSLSKAEPFGGSESDIFTALSPRFVNSANELASNVSQQSEPIPAEDNPTEVVKSETTDNPKRRCKFNLAYGIKKSLTAAKGRSMSREKYFPDDATTKSGAERTVSTTSTALTSLSDLSSTSGVSYASTSNQKNKATKTFARLLARLREEINMPAQQEDGEKLKIYEQDVNGRRQIVASALEANNAVLLNHLASNAVTKETEVDDEDSTIVSNHDDEMEVPSRRMGRGNSGTETSIHAWKMRSKSASKVKKTEFGHVMVREYERCVGDNPAVSSGVPISLGWGYLKTRVIEIDIFETKVRKPGPRTSKDFFLTPQQRFHVLLDDWGFSTREICLAKDLASEIRYLRQFSVFGDALPELQAQQQLLLQAQQQQQEEQLQQAQQQRAEPAEKSTTPFAGKRSKKSGKLPRRPKAESRKNPASPSFVSNLVSDQHKKR